MLEAQDVFADRFVVERLAGTGGMGRVYRALDRLTGEVVALKVLLDPGGADRFAREARLLADLAHPGIVRHVAHGESSRGEVYIAMEWLEGETLSARLKREPLDVSESLEIVRRVAEALSAAHARGIVHRDIKPANVLLVDGRVDRVKLLDFGIAHLSEASAMVTRTGAVLGTLGYMAPEQARGERNPGKSADVFSLGCVLFHCLTGTPAFAGGGAVAVLAKLILEQPPRLAESRPDLPRELDELVARMLHKEPEGRPADASEVAAELARLELGELSVPAPGPSTHADVLTGAEQRLVSVILAHQVLSADTIDDERTRVDGAQRGSDAPVLPAALREIGARHGAVLEPLRDGSIAALITGSALTGSAATDLTVRAARCALAMREALPEATIALSTGRGVVIADRLPVGEVIERAASLIAKGAAPAPAIVVDRITSGLLDVRFRLEPCSSGALLLSGERKIADVTRRLLGTPTTTIGRERELGFLMGLWQECTSEPMARVAIVLGPAGIGKSRLRYEFIRRLEDPARAPEVFIARGDPVGRGSPFGLLAQIVRRAAGIFDGEPAELSRSKLTRRVARRVAARDAERVAMFLGEIARLPYPAEGRPELEAARRDVVLMADQTRRAFTEFVAAECAAAPVLIVLEDLHWGDQPTVGFVDAALREAADLPLMVLALARPEVRDVLGELWTRRDPQLLRLGGLTRKAAEKLVREVLGEHVDAEVVTRIVERAEGNAFFLEELIRSVAEGEAEALPETLVAMVQARLEALPDGARRVLRAASVFGGVFWDAAIASMTGQEFESGAINEFLRLLVERELITPRAESRFPGTGELVFRHALVREAAYEMLTPSDQKLGHRLAGRWLEDNGEPDAMVLADHFERGAVPEQAFRWYRVAAEEALDANDFELVLRAVERALAAGGGAITNPVVGELERMRSEALYWTGRHAAALEAARLALDLLEPGGPAWYMGAAMLSTAAHRAGESAAVLAIAQRFLDERWVDQPGASAVIGASRITIALIQSGHYALADEILSRVAPNLEALADDGAARARWQASRAARALYTGRLGDYLELSQRAAENCALAGDLRSATIHRHNFGHANLELGLYREAESVLRQVASEAERLGLPNVVASAKNNLGFAIARLGRPAESIALLENAIETLEQQADLRMYGGACNHLAQVLLESARLEEAEIVARRAVEALASYRPLLCQARGTLARVLLTHGRIEAAVAIARDALELLDELGSMADGEVAARLVMAEALRAAGDEQGFRREIITAERRLTARASEITDRRARQAFLENVPENARTLELFAQGR